MSTTEHCRFFSLIVLAVVAAALVFFGTGCSSDVNVHHDPQKIDINVHHDPQKIDIDVNRHGKRRRHHQEKN